MTREFDRHYSEARPLAVETVREAFNDLQSARARHREARERYQASEARAAGPDDPQRREWERWLDAKSSFEHDAETRVITSVLMALGSIEGVDEVEEQDPGWGAVSFMVGGTLLVVGPFGKDQARPRLVAIEDPRLDSEDNGAGEWTPD